MYGIFGVAFQAVAYVAVEMRATSHIAVVDFMALDCDFLLVAFGRRNHTHAAALAHNSR